MLRLYDVLYCLNQEYAKISHCSSLGAVATVEPPTNEHINLGRVRAVVHTSINLLRVWGPLPVIKAVKPQPIRMGNLESGSLDGVVVGRTACATQHTLLMPAWESDMAPDTTL